MTDATRADVIALLHSPLVGPTTWQGVAERLRALGIEVVVCDLTPPVRADPPLQPGITRRVIASLDASTAEAPAVLVGHSMAGLLVPGVVQALTRPVAAVVLVDSALPRPGATWFDTAPLELAAHLHHLAVHGWLPPWDRWFRAGTLASLLPDPAVRERFTAELPRLPIGFFDETLGGDANWAHGIACGYVLLSEAYRDAAVQARDRGWEVTELDLHHLAPVTDPGLVATTLSGLIDRVRPRG